MTYFASSDWPSNLNKVSRDAGHCDHLPRERSRSCHPPFRPKTFTLFWPKKPRSLGHYQWEAWAWLGRAGRRLGADILAAGEPALPLHALRFLRSSPLQRLSTTWGSSFIPQGSTAALTLRQSDMCLDFSALSYQMGPNGDSFLTVGRIWRVMRRADNWPCRPDSRPCHSASSTLSARLPTFSLPWHCCRE